MHAQPAIEFHGVSKLYQLGESSASLREAFGQAAARLARRRPRHEPRSFWAVRDVTLDVQRGESLGIIGHNGAGKSTILKLLSRITDPTSGSIVVSGRLAALIELGAGFHPDLTGRENIDLNGVILGMRRAEVAQQFDSIVAFAGLEDFIDTPVKRYSSGMYVRLAFAVAAHVRADVLLIDEVLSVGDAAFQDRCMAKMRELKANGATIVYISHNLWSVQTFCDRAVLMDHGRIAAEGPPAEVIDLYRQAERQAQLGDALADSQADDSADDSADAVITGLEMFDARGGETGPRTTFDPNAVLDVSVRYRLAMDIAAPVFVVKIRRADGVVCCSVHSRGSDALAAPARAGEGGVAARIGPLPLIPDQYTIEAHIVDRDSPIVFASSARMPFRIGGELAEVADAGVFAPGVEWLGWPN